MTKSHGWETMPVPEPLRSMNRSARGFIKGECRVLVAQEPSSRNSDKLTWHLSISCEYRYPTWEEIKDARYALLPLGLTFAQLLPPQSEYINLHNNCFHLWEVTL